MCLLLASFCSASADDIADRIDAAARLYETGKPDSAAVILYDAIDAITDRDEKVRAMYFLAQSLGQLGRTAEKIQYLVMASGISPRAPYADEVRYAHAEALLKSGNANGCLAVAQEFLAARRESRLLPEMLSLTGEAFVSLGEWLKAYNAYSEITRSFPDTPIARETAVKEGVCLFRLNLVRGSVERFERYLAENQRGESTAEALYYFGLSHERIGRPLQAVAVFRRLTVEYPSSPNIVDAFFRLGKNLYDTGEYAEAENAFYNYTENAARSLPSYDEALLYLERIAYRKGYYSSEMDIAEQFVLKNPRSRLAPRMFLDLGRYYRLSGDAETAIGKYRTLMGVHPRTDFADSALFYIADVYLSANRFDDAVSFLQVAAIRRSGARAPAAYYKLGLIGEEWLMHDSAIAWFDSSAALSGSSDLSVRALMGVGRCYRAVNRWLDASRTFERIVKTYPNTQYKADVYYSLAEVYYLMGRLFDSVQAARDGLKLAHGKKRADFLVFLADAYEYIDTDQSIQYYWSVWSNSAAPPSMKTEALLKMGDLFVKKGDRRNAAEMYGRVMNGEADSLMINKARKRLDDLGDPGDTAGTEKPQ